VTNKPPYSVLHLASGDLWAGAEVQLFTLARKLVDNPDISVTVVLLNHGTLERKLLDAGIKTIVLDELKFNGLQILSRLTRTLRELNPDIVHTHRPKENILGSIAARLSSNIPCLRTTHGAPEHSPAWWQLSKQLIIFLDRFCGYFLQKRIVAVSKDLANKLRNSFPSNRICVIENGIDLDAIRSQTVIKDPESESRESPFRVGLAGRLVPVKRVDIFIHTAQYSLDHHPDLNASFHIFGDGTMRQELENLCQETKTGEIVHFEGHQDSIIDEIQKLDVLLMTSDHEGLPMILLEAMALKIPIIAHSVGGIPRLLDQGSCGILVPGQNASDYANEIYRLSKSPRILSDISKNALNRVRTHYSAEQNARAYLSEYSSILQCSR